MESSFVGLAADCWSRLRDAVQPADCAVCPPAQAQFVPAAAPRSGLCRNCGQLLDRLRRPFLAAPALAGTPPCASAGVYQGTLRACLLAYKERRRRDLAWDLRKLLARAVAACVDGPVILAPVPATAASARSRGFDHVTLLCRRTETALPEVRTATVLGAAPRPDSAGLTVAQRAQAARASLYARSGPASRLREMLRRRPRTSVLLVDDIVTSGATLAAARAVLENVGAAPIGAVVAAATPRQNRDDRDGDICGAAR